VRAVWACSVFKKVEEVEEWSDYLVKEYGKTKIQGICPTAWLISQSIDDKRSKTGFGHRTYLQDSVTNIKIGAKLLNTETKHFTPMEKLLCASCVLWNLSSASASFGIKSLEKSYSEDYRESMECVDRLLDGLEVVRVLKDLDIENDPAISRDVLLSLGISLLHSLHVIAPDPVDAWKLVPPIAQLIYLRGHSFVHRSAFTKLLADLGAPPQEFWMSLPDDINGHHMTLSILAASYDKCRSDNIGFSRLSFVSDMRKWAANSSNDICIEQSMIDRITKAWMMGYKAWQEDPAIRHEMERHIIDVTTPKIIGAPAPMLARL
jgi:hypothetical protein